MPDRIPVFPHGAFSELRVRVRDSPPCLLVGTVLGTFARAGVRPPKLSLALARRRPASDPTPACLAISLGCVR